MKQLVLLTSVFMLVLIWSCGNSDTNDKTKNQTTEQTQQNVEKKESKIPKGYPSELTVPPGFKASQIVTGEGTGSRTIKKDGNISFGEEQTFKSYKIWKMNPSNAPELIKHYKKLTTALEYEGNWEGDGINESARGLFVKGTNELELKISTEQFSFNLKVWSN